MPDDSVRSSRHQRMNPPGHDRVGDVRAQCTKGPDKQSTAHYPQSHATPAERYGQRHRRPRHQVRVHDERNQSEHSRQTGRPERQQDREALLSAVELLACRLRSDAMIETNRQDGRHSEGENDLKGLVVAHRQPRITPCSISYST